MDCDSVSLVVVLRLTEVSHLSKVDQLARETRPLTFFCFWLFLFGWLIGLFCFKIFKPRHFDSKAWCFPCYLPVSMKVELD